MASPYAQRFGGHGVARDRNDLALGDGRRAFPDQRVVVGRFLVAPLRNSPGRRHALSRYGRLVPVSGNAFAPRVRRWLIETRHAPLTPTQLRPVHHEFDPLSSHCSGGALGRARGRLRLGDRGGGQYRRHKLSRVFDFNFFADYHNAMHEGDASRYRMLLDLRRTDIVLSPHDLNGISAEAQFDRLAAGSVATIMAKTPPPLLLDMATLLQHRWGRSRRMRFCFPGWVGPLVRGWSAGIATTQSLVEAEPQAADELRGRHNDLRTCRRAKLIQGCYSCR